MARGDSNSPQQARDADAPSSSVPASDIPADVPAVPSADGPAEDTAIAGAAAVRRLMHEALFGALGTVEADGGPYASLVAVAPDAEGQPLLLLSHLARHTRNFLREPRVSLLLAGVGGGDPLNGPRASLIGTLAPATEPDVRARFLAHHSTAKGYADFADFAFYRLSVREAHLVEGFGRILTLPGTQVCVDWSGAEALAESEDGIVAHMNEDHADAIALYANRLLGASGEDWRMLAVDPLGCDLARGRGSDIQVVRLEFPQRVTSSAAVRQVLVDLVRTARG